MQLKYISKSNKVVKYLGINLTNDVQDLCVEYPKFYQRYIKEDLYKWRTCHVHE